MLEVKNLKKSFGDKKVLDDISFSLKEGECLGIVGQSGCGKNTKFGVHFIIYGEYVKL